MEYGRLTHEEAHKIASTANHFITNVTEQIESSDLASDRNIKKAIGLNDEILQMAARLMSRGIFSKTRSLCELLVYATAIARQCEVCALIHLQNAIDAGADEKLVEIIKKIGLCISTQSYAKTYLLFDAYVAEWRNFEKMPYLSDDYTVNAKLYNLFALAMGMVAQKGRLVAFHTEEALLVGKASMAEILEMIGIAQAMGGLPVRWEVFHVVHKIKALQEAGLLAADFLTLPNGL